MTLADLPTLPKIEIPQLPFEVPLLMHPAVVHFAIAIPIIVLILELFNLIFKRRALNIITSVLLVTLSVIYLALYVTGKTDGSEAFALFSDEAKTAFKAHVQIGTYLIYSSILLIVFKVMALLFKKPFFKVLYLIVMIAFIGVNLKQGKGGGELVYVHGANVEAMLEASSDVDDLNDELEELQEELDSLKEELSTLKEEKETLKCKDVQESIDVIMKEESEDTAKEPSTLGDKIDDIVAEVVEKPVSQESNVTEQNTTIDDEVISDDIEAEKSDIVEKAKEIIAESNTTEVEQ
jgi:uncharacterized membrane protein